MASCRGEGRRGEACREGAKKIYRQALMSTRDATRGPHMGPGTWHGTRGDLMRPVGARGLLGPPCHPRSGAGHWQAYMRQQDQRHPSPNAAATSSCSHVKWGRVPAGVVNPRASEGAAPPNTAAHAHEDGAWPVASPPTPPKRTIHRAVIRLLSRTAP